MANRFLVDIPPEHVDYARGVLEHEGINRAIERLDLGRTALLGVIARGKASAGSASLLREAYRRRSEVA